MRQRTQIEADAKKGQHLDALLLEVLLDIRDQNRRLVRVTGSNPEAAT